VKLDGVELNVADRGRGPVVLFVHGFPLSHKMWQAQLDALAGQYRVIAPDLRGFGENAPADGTVSMERFADDLNALLDALAIDEPVTFCGLSMGGYVAWPFVRKYRRRLASLILCDTRSAADTLQARATRWMLAQQALLIGVQPVVDAMLPRLFSAGTLERRKEVVDEVRAMIAATPLSSMAAALRGMAERPDSTPLLPEIKVPTLVVAGAEDKITPADEMRRVAQAIPGAEFVEIADAGHMAPMENPDAVNAAVTGFLKATART
jgi:pimeloyl-ACP methyl ester carboxylesterase